MYISKKKTNHPNLCKSQSIQYWENRGGLGKKGIEGSIRVERRKVKGKRERRWTKKK